MFMIFRGYDISKLNEYLLIIKRGWKIPHLVRWVSHMFPWNPMKFPQTNPPFSSIFQPRVGKPRVDPKGNKMGLCGGSIQVDVHDLGHFFVNPWWWLGIPHDLRTPIYTYITSNSGWIIDNEEWFPQFFLLLKMEWRSPFEMFMSFPV